MRNQRRPSIAQAVLVGAGLLVGAPLWVWADPEPNAQCDHIHVRGHVRTPDGKGVDGAELVWGDGPTATGAARGRGLPAFVQGVPSDCDCGTPHIKTGADGSYELKIRIGPGPQCTSAVDRITIDKSKMFWNKPGVTITPAP